MRSESVLPEAVMDQVLRHTQLDTTPGRILLSKLVPGQAKTLHVDPVADDWLYRIHIPVTSNEQAWFCFAEDHIVLHPGHAYAVNITKPHAPVNLGDNDRIHLMCDIHGERTWPTT